MPELAFVSPAPTVPVAAPRKAIPTSRGGLDSARNSSERGFNSHLQKASQKHKQEKATSKHSEKIEKIEKKIEEPPQPADKTQIKSEETMPSSEQKTAGEAAQQETPKQDKQNSSATADGEQKQQPKEGPETQQSVQQPTENGEMSTAEDKTEIKVAAETMLPEMHLSAQTEVAVLDATKNHVSTSDTTAAKQNASDTKITDEQTTAQNENLILPKNESTKILSKIALTINQQQGIREEGAPLQKVQQRDNLLGKLQNIVDAGEETGTVSISVTQTVKQKPNNTSLAETQPLQAEMVGKISQKNDSSNTNLFRILDEEVKNTTDEQMRPATQQQKEMGSTESSTTTQTLSTQKTGKPFATTVNTEQLQDALAKTPLKEFSSPKKEFSTSIQPSPKTGAEINAANTQTEAINNEKAVEINAAKTAANAQTEAINNEKAVEINAAKTAANAQTEATNNQKAVEIDTAKTAANTQTETTNNQKAVGTQTGSTTKQQYAAPVTDTTPSEGSFFSSDSGSSTFFGSQSGQSEFTETISSPTQTITLPSGAVVRENEVVRQFMDKFQINGRNLESRINIKLNPAELGEIKIDLSVKEKSIKANVLAQSQVTQGILEKNLDKLKTMLEAQGFTISEINITAGDEASGDFNLFEQEFSQQQENKQKKSSAKLSHQDDTEQKTEKQDDTRVNLTI